MKKNDTHQDILFTITVIAIAIVMIWKAYRGLGFNDEHFYIALGYRLWQGDALIVDEMFSSVQLMSVFIYPFVSFFRLFHSSNEGIVLYFRFCYTVYTLIIGTCIYLRFRKKGYAAIVASAVYMLFTPFSVMALSYNTMAVGFFILAVLVYPINCNSRKRMVLSGLFYACAVLNNPYLILLYAILTVMTIVRKDLFSHQNWLDLTIGACIPVICFILFVFSRASWIEIKNALPYFVDSSHKDSLLMTFAKNGGKLVLRGFKGLSFILIGEMILTFFFRKKPERQKQYFLNLSLLMNVFICIYVLYLKPYNASLGGFALILIPFTIQGIEILMLENCTKEEKILFSLGLFIAFTFMLSTNVGPESWCCPLIFCCVMTVFLMNEHMDFKVSSIGMLAFILMLCGIRLTNIFYGENDFSVTVSRGPLKGLKGSDKSVSSYYEKLDDIETINSLPLDYMQCITNNTWEYLASDKRMSSNSAYPFAWNFESWKQAQDVFYQHHPSRFPCYVYLDYDNPYSGDEENEWVKNLEYKETLRSGVLYIRK